MEKKVRKKRPQGASGSSGNETAKTGTRPRPAQATSKKLSAPAEVQFTAHKKILNMPLNPETARQAIVLSEIIGKPVSKRSIRR